MIAPGFTAEDYEDDEADVLLWPENEAVYALFQAMDTQWLYASPGMSVIRVGLRYEAVYPYLDRIASSNEEWNELFQGLRIMESAALAEWAKLINEKR